MNILLIEDDIKFCESLSYQLIQEKLNVDTCHNGLDAIDLILDQKHDLILLDRMLPGLDGLSILKRIRKEGINTHVILITALGEINDRITGLDSGADDYIVKPFAFEELMARIRCISRRPVVITDNKNITFKDITFDINERILTSHDKNCSLSKKESSLLETFISNPTQTLSRDKLLSAVWGVYADCEDGNLDNYIYFLRRRLKSVNSILTIKTVRGLGYKLGEKDV